MSHLSEYLKLLVGLLAVMACGSAVPVYLALTAECTLPEKRKLATVAVSAAVATLLLFALAGSSILSALNISVPAFRVAGGIIVLRIALSMVSAEPKPVSVDSKARTLVSLAVVPMAIPSMAGPAAMTTVIVFSQMHSGLQHLLTVLVVILGAGIIVLGMLWFASWISRAVGPMGIIIFQRVMALIIAAIAVEFILDGLAMHFPDLFHFQGHQVQGTP